MKVEVFSSTCRPLESLLLAGDLVVHLALDDGDCDLPVFIVTPDTGSKRVKGPQSL